MRGTDPGSAREEAERLVATVLAAARLAAGHNARGAGPFAALGDAVLGAFGPAAGAGRHGGTPAGGFATGSAECCVCPVCRVMAALRDPSPEFAERLATGAGDFAAGLASLLRSFAAASGDAGERTAAPEDDAGGRTAAAGDTGGWTAAAGAPESGRADAARPDPSAPDDRIWRAATRPGDDSWPAATDASPAPAQRDVASSSEQDVAFASEQQDVWAAATRADAENGDASGDAAGGTRPRRVKPMARKAVRRPAGAPPGSDAASVGSGRSPKKATPRRIDDDPDASDGGDAEPRAEA
ncbi:hypothetical protein SAMN05444365_105125 [Micromonospora pattaloongensis]|uniref:Uncharacterized protein n=1 Tax=Micromonospora pattaloongensis TaxID=405436 RepID=A0A1H3PZP8_9ACTN|nr:hypothetical protein [Micromonospora pattaloongensis]SDZ06411.1 hypothetical protein SAMN05444365_105125 [Micromonospora pattaloongensis]